MVLSDFSVYATLPAADLERARRFYEDKLGLKPGDVSPAGVMYHVQGSGMYLYPSTFAGTNKATAAGFNVTDVVAMVADLKARGITFEEYDMGGEYKTVNGIMKTPDGLAAWFKDTEGNIIGLVQR
jgi:predicted enzyme related to lactoylglutathione lyase